MTRDPAECVSENELLSWVAGRLPESRIQALDAHLDRCEYCQALVAEASRDSFRDSPARRQGITFATGELVCKRYRILRFIARGGMGEVYEAEDQWLKERVALKTLTATIADDPVALSRLKAEVQLSRRLSHRNVCRVFDLGFHQEPTQRLGAVSENIPFLTMELLSGETLRQHLERTGPMEPSELVPLLEQLVSALGEAHAAGVVHRDFKPDNVILSTEPGGTLRAVVTDFGLARSILPDSGAPITEQSNTVLGTLDYMAPEQVEGKPATERSDVYALGVVLFELLTGQLPFRHSAPATRALMRLRANPPRPSAIRQALDPRWDRLVLKCLARNAAGRFERVEQVLETIASGRSAEKNWRLPAAATIAVTTAIALFAGFGWHSRAAEGTRIHALSPELVATTRNRAQPVPPAPTEDASDPVAVDCTVIKPTAAPATATSGRSRAETAGVQALSAPTTGIIHNPSIPRAKRAPSTTPRSATPAQSPMIRAAAETSASAASVSTETAVANGLIDPFGPAPASP